MQSLGRNFTLQPTRWDNPPDSCSRLSGIKNTVYLVSKVERQTRGVMSGRVVTVRDAAALQPVVDEA